MDETSALKVSALRALETTDAARTLWSDDDRRWASRAAAEVVGANAAPETFLSRRAALALERIEPRQAAFARTVRGLRWRPWVGHGLVIAAVAFGIFIDQVGSAQRVNILAPPVLGLLIWNVAVYVVLGAGYVIRYGENAAPGPLRSAIVRVAGGLSRPRHRGAMRDAMIAFLDDWGRRSASLYAVRAARILHVAAAALAVGVIAGLYLRRLAFEYRASWESTFLDAPTVRSIAAFAYAPGALVTGIAIPNVDAVTAIRAPAAENASRWVHLMNATVFAVVILPRLVLALIYGMVERHRAARLPLALDDPYFQRLLRVYRGGPARVRVIPYSYTPTPAAIAGLQSVVARAFGGDAAIDITQPIAYGTDDTVDGAPSGPAASTIVALFNASATPEREVHGAFLAALAGEARAETLFALIDEGAWMARWRSEPARISDRRKAWLDVAQEARVPVLFVDLSTPDLIDAENALEAVLAQSAR